MNDIPIWERAQGRWQTILPALGIDQRSLTGRHGPCPICKRGTDRFRFDNKEGRGTFICNQCGSGDGVNLVMKVHNLSFREAAEKIEEIIGKGAPVETRPERDERKCRDQMNQLWKASAPVTAGDAVDRYLRARGIELSEFPPCLRTALSVPYFDDLKTMHPAMLAKLTAPDGTPASIHRTYLTNDAAKAAVKSPRRMMPGAIAPGSAVRLMEHGEVLGVAEGIETAYSASILFNVPVWAAINANMLAKWIPPEGVRNVVIFGDNDSSHAGQAAAHELARRLIAKGTAAIVSIPKAEGDDWNDVLKLERAAMPKPERKAA